MVSRDQEYKRLEAAVIITVGAAHGNRDRANKRLEAAPFLTVGAAPGKNDIARKKNLTPSTHTRISTPRRRDERKVQLERQ